MRIPTFLILKDQQGGIYAYYESPGVRKLIDGFDKIPYTPETLLEDFLNGFPDHPDCSSARNEFVRDMCDRIYSYLYLELYRVQKQFQKIVSIRWDKYDDLVRCSLNKDMVSDNDILFFNEMLLGERKKGENFGFCFNIVSEDNGYL